MRKFKIPNEYSNGLQQDQDKFYRGFTKIQNPKIIHEAVGYEAKQS